MGKVDIGLQEMQATPRCIAGYDIWANPAAFCHAGLRARAAGRRPASGITLATIEA
jgi:hypothetical protein